MSDRQQIFKIVLSKAFDLKCTIPEITNVGEPLLIYQSCCELLGDEQQKKKKKSCTGCRGNP